MKNKPFLSDEEQRTLQDTIAECERRTSAEIAVAIRPESYTYPQAVFFGSLVLSMIPAVLVNLALHFLLLWTGPDLRHLWIFPSVFTVCFFIAFFVLLNIRPLKRLFMSKDMMLEEVKEAAVTSYYGFGLDRTDRHNGLLIYVSILEKQVHVIAGHGIRDVIEDGTWQPLVNDLTAEISKGRQGKALVEAACRATEILAPAFPPDMDDRNELKNLYFDEPRPE